MNTLLRRSVYVLAIAFALLAASARLHSQYMSQANQPNAVATFVQGQHDPMEAARMGMIPPAPEPSALDRLSEPVRRRSARKDAA